MKRTHLTLVIVFLVTIFCSAFPRPQNHQAEIQDTTTQVWTSEKSFSLSPMIELTAKQINANLNNSPLFYPRFIRKPPEVRRYLSDKNCGRGITFTCKTEDRESITCTHFDRGSDTLIVVGAGFTNPKEYMAPFVGMFDCDIAIFDYRGHGYNERKWYNPFTWTINPAQIFFSIYGHKVKMGEAEDKDVIAVVETLKKKKRYRQVCGLGICYSSLIFIKAQATYKEKTGNNLFDKLMGDGTWLSLSSQIDRITNDLKLLGDPQHGGCYHKWPIGRPWFTKALSWFFETLSRIPFRKLRVNILDYINKIDVPLLFFHGKYDKFVPLEEFKILWDQAITEQKVAILTSNPHVRNHLKQKELYKLLCNLFLELPHKKFVQCLQDVKQLVTQQVNKYQEKLQDLTH